MPDNAPDAFKVARVHGLVRLRRSPASPTGVEAAGPGEADVVSPGDLPEHLVELHAFGSREAANGFSEGVAAAASNTVRATASCGAGGLVVLLARLDAPRNPVAPTLEEAVPLVAHGAAAPRKGAFAAAAHEEANLLRDAAVASARASWSAVKGVIDSLPKPRRRHPDEFTWRLAALDVRRGPDGSPTGDAKLEGTFDPNPPWPEAGSSPMHREHVVYLERGPGGSVTARLDLPGSGAGVSREAVRWREERIAAACAAAGWRWDAAALVPAWNGDPAADGGGGLRSALLSLPALVRECAAHAEQAARIQRAAEIAADPQLGPILRTLAGDPDARILQPADGQGSPRVEARSGGRQIRVGALNRLAQLGLVGVEGGRALGAPRSWALSKRGLAAATSDAEALAAAMGDEKARLAIRRRPPQDAAEALAPGGPRR